MSKGESFVIDQAGTFESAVLMGVDPKVEFRSTEQKVTKGDGVPMWVAELGVTRKVFGRSERSILKVNIASRVNPGDGIAPFSPVTVNGLEANVGPRTDRDNKPIPGIQVWYRADGIQAAASGGRGKGGEG